MAGKESEGQSTPFIPQEEYIAAPEKPEDRCGIVGIRTFEPTAHFDRLIRAAYGVQHRGQLGGRIRIVQEDGSEFFHGGDGEIREVFTRRVIEDEDLMNRKGKLSGFHARYGTDGDWGEGNLQPIIRTHNETGTMLAVFHNGQFVNISKMRKEVGEEIDDGASDTHLFAEMLARSEGNTWDERILSIIDRVDGAYNLIIHVNDSMYVARDGFGLHPLERGKISFPDTEGVMVASETSAFTETGALYEREVRRGEVFRVDDEGITQLREGFDSKDDKADRKKQLCALEYAYFQRPDSLDYKGRAIALTRKRFGEIMGKRVKIPNADFVVGLPDSGKDFALGFANASGIPFENYIQRNRYGLHGSRRAFQNDYDIPGIGAIVANKFLIIPGQHWEDAVVVIGDDSIFRGSGTGKVVPVLRDLGAKEIHCVIGFPPVKHRCHLAISIRTIEELIANQGDVAKLIGADSVDYILPEEFAMGVRGEETIFPADPSTTLLENGLCGGCTTGIYPITKEGVVWQSSGQVKEPEFVHK